MNPNFSVVHSTQYTAVHHFSKPASSPFTRKQAPVKFGLSEGKKWALVIGGCLSLLGTIIGGYKAINANTNQLNQSLNETALVAATAKTAPNAQADDFNKTVQEVQAFLQTKPSQEQIHDFLKSKGLNQSEIANVELFSQGIKTNPFYYRRYTQYYTARQDKDMFKTFLDSYIRPKLSPETVSRLEKQANDTFATYKQKAITTDIVLISLAIASILAIQKGGDER